MTTFPMASIPQTEVQTIQSSAVGQGYRISIALPATYHDYPETTYPVIYLLDADFYFGLVTEMVRIMGFRVPFCDELPDAIIVGVGYPTSGSLPQIYHEVLRLRTRDFLPIVDRASEEAMQNFFPGIGSVESGGASRFLQFVYQELIPVIDTTYRTAPTDRTLLGHSWGGLFALYTLFQLPELFQRYVVVSPDLPLGNGFIHGLERDYAQKHTRLPIKLYLAFGEGEINDWERPHLDTFVNTVKQQPYTEFQFTYQVIADCKHGGVVAPAFRAGLSNVFDTLS